MDKYVNSATILNPMYPEIGNYKIGEPFLATRQVEPKKPFVIFEYIIEDWNPTFNDKELPPFNVNPVITFTPTLEFLEFARRNNYFIAIEVTGTGSEWHDGPAFGIVDNASIVNCNLSNSLFGYSGTKYSVTLQSPWFGYPIKSNGKFRVLSGMVIPKEIEFKVNKPRASIM
jgi:hypothetical protein